MHIYTSIAANYIPKARVLAASVKKHAPHATFHLLIADDIPEGFTLDNEPFDTIITPHDLSIPNLHAWLFTHSIVEACTAVKPFALKYLLETVNADYVCYFDPDIALFSPLTNLEEEFAVSSVLLTPHQCTPETEISAIIDNELCSSKHGLYNLGFVGVKNDATGRAYAQWWADRCFHFCYDDIPSGIFTDQKWNDFTPIFFDDVALLKNPEYNVSTWNYSKRRIEGNVEDGFTVDGVPLCFHHFSGVDSGDHVIMREKYGTDMPATLALSEWYEQACNEHAQEELSQVPWRYGHYDNGEPIAQAHRQLFRSRGDLQDAFSNPYATSSQNQAGLSYMDWLKNENLWDLQYISNQAAPQENMPHFLSRSQQDLTSYIQGNKHLCPWQQRALVALLNGTFRIATWLISLDDPKKNNAPKPAA